MSGWAINSYGLGAAAASTTGVPCVAGPDPSWPSGCPAGMSLLLGSGIVDGGPQNGCPGYYCSCDNSTQMLLKKQLTEPQNIAIIGGGLAALLLLPGWAKILGLVAIPLYLISNLTDCVMPMGPNNACIVTTCTD